MPNAAKVLSRSSVLARRARRSSPTRISRSTTIAANADVETLPPDESSETPSNELVNGSDNPDVNDLNASANSY